MSDAIGKLIKSMTFPDRACMHTFGLVALYEKVGEEALHRGIAMSPEAVEDWLDGMPLEEVDHCKAIGVSIGADGEIVQ